MPTVTIEVSDETYRLIQQTAQHQSRTVADVTQEALSTHLEAATRESSETSQAIKRGIADGEAGREKPWEQFVAEFEAQHQKPEEAQRFSDNLAGKV